MPANHSHHRRSRQTPEQIARTRQRHIVLLSLLVVLVFASTLGGGFIWTDREDILQGEHRLQSMADVPAALSQSREAYRSRHDGGLDDPASGTWQPLTLLSNSLSWGLWGDCSSCFHAENLLLHLIVVIGLYALGRHVLSQRRHGQRIAAWGAAVYAIHPATVTSVAWIGGRPYLLAAALGVWSLVIFTRLQATTKSHHGHVNRWLIMMCITALGAMLAHESAYLLPLLALLVAGYESKERGRSSVSGIAPRRLLALGLLLATLLLLVLYRHIALGGLAFSADFPTDSVLSNSGTALRHFWYLVQEVLLPSEPAISDAWPISQGWGATEVAAFLAALLAIVAILIGLKLGHPAAFGGAWLVLWLIPGVGVLPSEHYHNSQTLYLAAWGPALLVAYGLFWAWRPVGRQLLPGSEAVVFVPLLLVLGVITAFSNARWWDHDRLFQSEIAHDPHYMEGRVELAKSALERDDPGSAMNHALAAIEASQDKAFTGYWSVRDTYYLLGRAQWSLGMHTEAAGNFATALEQRPNDAELYYWRGISRRALQDEAGAESDLRRALELKQPFLEAEAELGVLLVGQERYVEAYPLLNRALEQGPGSAEQHAALARVLIDAGTLEDAAEQLEKALALREDAVERARLAWVSWRLGRERKARQDLNMALQLEEETSEYVEWVRTQLDTGPADDRPATDASTPIDET